MKHSPKHSSWPYTSSRKRLKPNSFRFGWLNVHDWAWVGWIDPSVVLPSPSENLFSSSLHIIWCKFHFDCRSIPHMKHHSRKHQNSQATRYVSVAMVEGSLVSPKYFTVSLSGSVLISWFDAFWLRILYSNLISHLNFARIQQLQEKCKKLAMIKRKIVKIILSHEIGKKNHIIVIKFCSITNT